VVKYNEADAFVTAGQIVVAVAVGVSFSTAIVKSVSPQSAFTIVNQFQLYILLPMIGAHIPEKVLSFIEGMSFTMFSFSFIPYDSIPLSSEISSLLDYDQSDAYIDSIGMTSGSALINQLALISIYLVIFMIHMAYLP